mgnify:CR=1 FL=1
MDSIDTEKVSESDANTLQMKEKEIKNYLKECWPQKER